MHGIRDGGMECVSIISRQLIFPHEKYKLHQMLHSDSMDFQALTHCWWIVPVSNTKVT